jgi:hypothetical protein
MTEEGYDEDDSVFSDDESRRSFTKKQLKASKSVEDIELLANSVHTDKKEGGTATCIIMQNKMYKIYWDLTIIALLLFVCIVIPWRITFIEEEAPGWYWSFIIIDCIFLVDMVITFFTSVTDHEKMLEVTSKKIIACQYMHGWFWVDFVSIFPFDEFTTLITSQGVPEGSAAPDRGPGGNVMIRTIKLGKLGKMIRLMRLLKVFKIMKNSEQLKSHFNKDMEINAGVERLVGIFLQFFFANHIFSLFWIILGEQN